MPPDEDHTVVLRQLFARTNVDRMTDQVFDSFRDRTDIRRIHPPAEQMRLQVRWHVELMLRALLDHRPPDDDAVETIREIARARAADGTPADAVPANLRRGARFGFAALLAMATDPERAALLDTVDVFFEHVDRVSLIYAQVYADAAATGRSTEQDEYRPRTLLDRLAHDETLFTEDHQYAARIGFAIAGAYRPFVLAVPDQLPPRHAVLAGQLRGAGALAVSEGRWVVGLGVDPTPWWGLDLAPTTIVARGQVTVRGELGRVLEELRMLVDLAATRGHTGEVELEDYLPELLLRRSPRLADRLRARVYDALHQADPQLVTTLDQLIGHDFDHARTAAALPVHRNTLRNRLHRIRDLTGIDLDHADGRGLAWLARLDRRPSPTPPPSAAVPHPRVPTVPDSNRVGTARPVDLAPHIPAGPVRTGL